MTLSSTFARIGRTIAERGIARFAMQLPRIVYRRVFPLKLPMHPFDVRHGVDTSGILYGHHLSSHHHNSAHANAYWGTHPSLFAQVLSRWKETVQISVDNYDFIDIGCGKGRVLLMASETPFASVTGIDLHQALIEIAQSNIHHWLNKPRACHNITVLTADALSLQLPDGPVAVYMYHPFNEEVMRPFMAHLRKQASTRRYPIDILYANPGTLHTVDFDTGITKLVDGEHTFSPEELAVDAFQDPNHRYVVLRMKGGI